jgi:hypothetical protein
LKLGLKPGLEMGLKLVMNLDLKLWLTGVAEVEAGTGAWVDAAWALT